MKAIAIALLAKICRTIPGAYLNISGTWVKPIPIVSDRATIVMLRSVKPAFAIIWKPDTAMFPNMTIVQPPSTAGGSELKTAATGGKKLARTRIRPPDRMTRRLTTLVMATRPIFWAKEVSGMTPKKPATEEMNPSPAMAPAVSLAAGSRSKPTSVRAAVSPSTSTAETRYSSPNEMIAPELNSGLNGRKWGTETGERPWKDEALTLPMHSARRYPITSPKSTESCLAVPLARNWKARQHRSVTVAMVIFCQLPKSAAPSPPPKDFAPTASSEKPIEVTTTADTIGGIIRRHHVAVRPRATSNSPPIMIAPITAP